MLQAILELLSDASAFVAEAVIGRLPAASRRPWLDVAIKFVLGFAFACVLLAALIYGVFWLAMHALFQR